jgi:serine/threonine-protein kinase
MEYLEGQTLRDAIQMEGAFSIQRATEIILQVLSGLSYAHLNGVVHRDIKPENVQLLPGGHVKITDFGIARLMGEASITMDGQVFGTPSYMSPEQVAGKNIDQRSDLFSTGVMLYELLAGHKPFSGDSVVTITYNIMHREPTPLPGVPPYLTSIVRKAMSKEPEGRYASADEMAADIKSERAPYGAVFPGDNFSPARPSSGTTFQGTILPPPTSTGFPPPTSSPSPRMTPYGTPMPTSDPFSSPASSYGQPRAQRDPILSPESRNFIGIFLLLIGLTGMLLFAIWAVNKAYISYKNGVGSTQATAYIDQGKKLFDQGKYDDAADQFRNAVRVSPEGPTAKTAKASLAACFVNKGVNQLNQGDIGSATNTAEEALHADPKSAPAHLLLGTIHSRTGQMDKAMSEWKLTIDSDPTSNEAKHAREYIGSVYYNQAVAYLNTGQQDKAIELFQKTVSECAGSDIAIMAQRQMDQIMGLSPHQ